MKRTIQGTAAIIALCSALPALAADYPDLRPAYEQGWENPDDDIRFEFGTAYWYSWGGQDLAISTGAGALDATSRDNTHIGDLHGKIEDLSTQTYLSGKAGIGFSTTGTYDISPAAAGDIGPGSRIGYAGADFGWLPLGNMREGTTAGGFVGYHYWKEAPDIGTGEYATAFAGVPTTLGDARNDLDIHALRLGIRGTAEFDMFDIQAEVAAVPYAHISGTLGGSAPDGFDFPGGPFYERAPTTLTGRGYGVMAESMVGFRPTENIALRVGGRAWYLEGQLDATLTTNRAGIDPQPAETIATSYARYFRYGLMAELTGRF